MSTQKNRRRHNPTRDATNRPHGKNRTNQQQQQQQPRGNPSQPNAWVARAQQQQVPPPTSSGSRANLTLSPMRIAAGYGAGGGAWNYHPSGASSLPTSPVEANHVAPRREQRGPRPPMRYHTPQQRNRKVHELRVSFGSDKDTFTHKWLELMSQPEMVSIMDTITSAMLPNSVTEYRRNAACEFMKEVIRSAVGSPPDVQVFPVGSYASRTYLPNSDADLCMFFNRKVTKFWATSLRKSLKKAVQKVAEHEIQQPEFIASSSWPIVKCRVDGIHIDISANATHSVRSAAFFEEVDRIVGRDHLFKRSLILVQAWMSHHARIMGSKRGYMSSYCLRTLVLYVFNAYHSFLSHPFQVLCRLLHYVTIFEWNRHVLTIQGPASIVTFQPIERLPASWPQGAQPLITQHLLVKYSAYYKRRKEFPESAGFDAMGTPLFFRLQDLNIVDPLDPFNNLGTSIHRNNVGEVTRGFEMSFHAVKVAVERCTSRTATTSITTCMLEVMFPVLQVYDYCLMEKGLLLTAEPSLVPVCNVPADVLQRARQEQATKKAAREAAEQGPTRPPSPLSRSRSRSNSASPDNSPPLTAVSHPTTESPVAPRRARRQATRQRSRSNPATSRSYSSSSDGSDTVLHEEPRSRGRSIGFENDDDSASFSPSSSAHPQRVLPPPFCLPPSSDTPTPPSDPPPEDDVLAADLDALINNISIAEELHTQLVSPPQH